MTCPVVSLIPYTSVTEMSICGNLGLVWKGTSITLVSVKVDLGDFVRKLSKSGV